LSTTNPLLLCRLGLYEAARALPAWLYGNAPICVVSPLIAPFVLEEAGKAVSLYRGV
jgi:hypothetical protein